MKFNEDAFELKMTIHEVKHETGKVKFEFGLEVYDTFEQAAMALLQDAKVEVEQAIRAQKLGLLTNQLSPSAPDVPLSLTGEEKVLRPVNATRLIMDRLNIGLHYAFRFYQKYS